jgi:hypothetical protein
MFLLVLSFRFNLIKRSILINNDSIIVNHFLYLYKIIDDKQSSLHQPKRKLYKDYSLV